LLLRESDSPPSFNKTSSGGHFKKKNPSVPIETLENNWVTDTKIVYIGKAGQLGKPPTIKQRLKQYLDFGAGIPVGHWGGRYIWQLSDAEDLIVCWKATKGNDPKLVESDLIDNFITAHSTLPFANLKKGKKG